MVFGKTSSATIDLGNLGTSGFRIEGIVESDRSGWSVSGAGDVNGDGRADLIIGAPGALQGESYVVFGKVGTTPIELGNLGSGGFRLSGINRGDGTGDGVSGAGDVNGDGLADVIVGASSADANGDIDAGESYVVFSASVPPSAATYRARSRNGNPPQTAVGISGDGSNHSSPDARFWIDFASGNDSVNSASSEVITVSRSPGALPSPGARVSWRLQTSRQNWASAEVTVRYLDSELLIGDERALELVFSPTGAPPFTPLASFVNPLDNTISANISTPGFLYIGQRAPVGVMFANGFESPPP